MQSIINQPKPHFYQYLEIQLLQSYIQRGIGYFINSIANSTDKLVWLRYYTDQISFLIDLLKDIVCLIKYNATYAEQFYQLQRKSLTQVINPASKNIKVLYHALITTLIPYLLNKIQKHFNTLIQEEQNQGRQLSLIEKIFTKTYPYLHLIISAIQTFMKFKYLLVKQERIFDIYYKLARTGLSYKQTRFQQAQQGKTHYPWMDLVKTPGLLAIMLGHKVLTWYFTQKNQRNFDNNGLMNRNGQNKMSTIEKYLSPLQFLNKNKDIISKRREQRRKQYVKGLCMICSRPISNPTVIRQNGYVYCYGCINEYIGQNGRCPITNIKVSQQNLQLVYSE